MNIRILQLASFVLISLEAIAQTGPIYNVPSPEIAGLGEYGKTPVSLYTGTPDISIPLYEVRAGDFSLPITANYHLASVKAATQPGPLGLGWSLWAGGYITRKVNTVPDEMREQTYTPGYYGNAYRLKEVTAGNLESHNAQAGNQVGKNTFYELAADEFSFRFGPYSGNFYYNQDGGWSVVSDDDIEVVFEPNNGGFVDNAVIGKKIDISDWYKRGDSFLRYFNKFTLITPDGCQYEFGGTDQAGAPHATEYCISYYYRQINHLIPTTWRLSKIITPQKQEITFTYDTSGIICDIQYIRRETVLYAKYKIGKEDKEIWHMNRNIGKSAYAGYLVFPAHIKRIDTPNETISFAYEKDLLYWKTFEFGNNDCLGWTMLAEQGDPLCLRYDPYLATYLGGSNSPATQFHVFLGIHNYSKFTSDAMFRDAITKALNNLVLKSISIKSRTDNSVCETILFKQRNETHGGRRQLLSIEERARAVSSSSLEVYDDEKPGTRIYTFAYDAQELPVSCVAADADIWGCYTGGTKDVRDEPNSIIRTPWLQHAKAGTLTAITYPTGGTTKFDYELHRCQQMVDAENRTLVPQKGAVCGLRIKQITDVDRRGDTLKIKRYDYTPEGSENRYDSSGILREYPPTTVKYACADGSVEITSRSGIYTSATDRNGPVIGYSHVREETLNGSGELQGAVEYDFSNYDGHPDDPVIYASPIYARNLLPYSSRSMERGKLLRKRYYNKEGRLCMETVCSYLKTDSAALKIVDQVPIQTSNLTSLGSNDVAGAITNIYLYRYLPGTVTEIHYPDRADTRIVRTRTYAYDAHKLLRKETCNTSEGTTRSVEYEYMSNDPYYQNTSMLRDVRHYLTPIVAKKTFVDDALFRTERYTYNVQNGRPYVTKKKTCFERGEDRTDYVVSHVDRWGNPLSVEEKGTQSVLFWGYGGQKLIARIENLPYSNLPNCSDRCRAGEAQEDYAYIEDLRKRFQAAHFYLYRYDDRLRLQSITNPNGLTCFFNYDFLGRLIETYYIEEVDGTFEKRILTSGRYSYCAH